MAGRSGMGGMPYWALFGRRPSTEEKKIVTPVTEVLIPLLQAMGIGVVIVAAGLLSLAALASWGRADWGAALTLVLGIGVTASVLSGMLTIGGDEEMSQGQALKGLAGLLAMGLLGIGGLFWGGRAVASIPDFDVALVRAGTVGFGVVGAVLVGFMLSWRRQFSAGVWWIVIVGVLTVLAYLVIPKVAAEVWWAWLLTLLAGGANAGGVYLVRAFRRELVDPYEPLPPYERVMVEWLERSLPGEAEEGERLILLNPPVRDAGAELRGRFEAFLHAAALDCSTRRLEGLGFGRDEIEEWRDLLIRGGYARWRSKDPRRGWELVDYPESILDKLTPSPTGCVSGEIEE